MPESSPLILSPDEQILWRGEPRPVPAINSHITNALCFSTAIFCVGASLLLLSREGLASPYWLPAIFAIAFTAGGILNWRESALNSRRSYTLTNQRAIFLLDETIESEYSISHMHYVKMVDVGKERGSVVFDRKTVGKSWAWVGFINIEKPHEVEAILREKWHQSPYPTE